MDLYEKEIILKKDYSFLIIDKSAKHDRRLWKCVGGKHMVPIRLDGSTWAGGMKKEGEESKDSESKESDSIDFIDIWISKN